MLAMTFEESRLLAEENLTKQDNEWVQGINAKWQSYRKTSELIEKAHKSTESDSKMPQCSSPTEGLGRYRTKRTRGKKPHRVSRHQMLFQAMM